ncbi:hypothetical protein KI387_019393, partial [Taxus chinensis]
MGHVGADAEGAESQSDHASLSPAKKDMVSPFRAVQKNLSAQHWDIREERDAWDAKSRSGRKEKKSQ